MGKGRITKIVALFFLLGASLVRAEDEVDAWYLSKGGEYLVRESINGYMHALMSTAKSGKPYVYLVAHDPDCEKDPGNVIGHNPLYVNGVLTRYSQYCDGSRRYFLPATDAGRMHVINEFKQKKFVEITTHDGGFKALFSAKGFTDIYNKVVFLNAGI